jgi:gliding motility-associated-like protein
MKKLILLIFFHILCIETTHAQIDRSFWFAAPDVAQVSNVNGSYDRPIDLRLTTLSASAIVTISMPANPFFTPITLNIAGNSTSTVNLEPWIDLIENSQPDTTANKGLLIQSSNDITAYYEVNSRSCSCNPELFALKGRNALGNEFYIPSQRRWSIDTVRHPTALSSFDIVATENNTIVSITPSRQLINRSANVTFVINLNKGQTFSSQGLYRNGANLLGGSYITSSKPIAVTTKEDLLFGDGDCADLAGDQLIPTSSMGYEFVIVRGNLNPLDQVIITAVQNGTQVFRDGDPFPTALLNAGQSFGYDLGIFDFTLYIKTNKPVNVIHYSGSTRCEVGSAIIPKINCTGSSSVSIVKTSSFEAYVMLVTKNGNQGNFLVNGISGIINAVDFQPVLGTNGAYYYCKKDLTREMPLNAATTITNSTGKFQLGFLNAEFGGGCKYGYFSDFKKSNVNASQVELCRLDSAQLNAFGGLTYRWSPSIGLSNTNTSNPKASPPTTTNYKVIITDAEGCIDSAFVKVIINSCSTNSCDNWLLNPSSPASVSLGDIDITGNQMTIEAKINRTAPYIGGNQYAGDIVSKHVNPSDANYLLRPNSAEITTSNGYFVTPPICPIELNKTYHIALVYDGALLKFYRNGFLMSQVNATGNLFQNDFDTRIAYYAAQIFNTQFIGYINEVRIWSVPRTQAQLRANMNTSLTNPVTQTGLLAYYTFDNLLNKQGNTAFNGTINGVASINAANPNCAIVADSCDVRIQQGISSTINDYTPALSLEPCKNILTVEDGTAYKTGDTILLIQMKGAIIDSSNTAAFGTLTNLRNAGNYEFNYIKSRTGNQIELKNKLTRGYDFLDGKVQLIRVPYFINVNVTGTLTCLPWDGKKGGVLVFNVKDTINLQADIDVSGNGFKGGADPATNPTSYFCNENDFFYPNNPDVASEKGEGIASISVAKSYGKGALANGGGGGNSHNSGGAGGANIVSGGLGGYQYESSPCNSIVPFDNRGFGGNPLTYNNTTNKIFLGGGGGGGQSNNPEDFESKGGNGSGIIIVSANYLKSNGKKIIANGADASSCGLTTSGCHEGMGGGGAGGAILLNINTYLDGSLIDAKGGKGGDMTTSGFTRVGPGGGGGGGIAWFKQAVRPLNTNTVLIGGMNGVCTAYTNDPWGSTPGQNGQSIFNLLMPIDTVLFRANIDSVRMRETQITCRQFNFNGLAFTNGSNIQTWQWNFGDGSIDSVQNTSHTYSNTGAYTVKLIVIDINGCKDSILKNINVSSLNVRVSPPMSVCKNTTFNLQGSSTVSNVTYSWSPGNLLNDSTLQNPTANISTSTVFKLTVRNPLGCTDTATVRILVKPDAVFSIDSIRPRCINTGIITLNANGGQIYAWTPIGLLSNPNIKNPTINTNTLGATTFYVHIVDTTCNQTGDLNTIVTINPLPQISARKLNDLDCSNGSTPLFATGGRKYVWTPSVGLNDSTIANPIASPTVTTTYYLQVVDANGCKDTSSVTVYVTRNNKSTYEMPNAFTPNGDGKNDCFGIKYWGLLSKLDFTIFNRWGEIVFHTNNPNECWDGKHKGISQDAALFLYLIKATTTCDVIEKKGSVLLIR